MLIGRTSGEDKTDRADGEEEGEGGRMCVMVHGGEGSDDLDDSIGRLAFDWLCSSFSFYPFLPFFLTCEAYLHFPCQASFFSLPIPAMRAFGGDDE